MFHTTPPDVWTVTNSLWMENICFRVVSGVGWFSEGEKRVTQLFSLIPSHGSSILLFFLVNSPKLCHRCALWQRIQPLLFSCTEKAISLPFFISDYKLLKGMGSVGLIHFKSSMAPLQSEPGPHLFFFFNHWPFPTVIHYTYISMFWLEKGVIPLYSLEWHQ